MSRASINLQKINRDRIKLDPILELVKHVRSPRNFKNRKSGKILAASMRICSSLSPKLKLAEAFLDDFDFLCENTRKNIGYTKHNVVSLSIKIGKNQGPEDEFEERKNELIGQCQEFMYDRKFTLKSQQQMLDTKKLHRTVTKRMLGE